MKHKKLLTSFFLLLLLLTCSPLHAFASHNTQPTENGLLTDYLSPYEPSFFSGDSTVYSTSITAIPSPEIEQELTAPIVNDDASPKYTIVNYDTAGQALAGARLQILDSQGTVVQEWTTDGTEYVINGLLIAGETYTLHEVSAPAGYILAEDVSFTVSEDGSIDEILMEDDTTKVELSKVSALDGSLISGAHLQILDSAGKVIYEWTTDGSILHLEALLIAGEDYTLHEVAAPEGYVVAGDVHFAVSLDGSIDEVQLMDSYTKVEFTKRSALDGNMLTGAVLQVIDRNGTIIDQWTTDGTVHSITALLKAGETYTLHELSAPAGYVLADDITFTVSTNGTVDRVTMTNQYTQVKINKVSKSDNQPLSGATLQVTTSSGSVVDQWISDGTAHEINATLIAGEAYILKELQAPEGYYLADPVEFIAPINGEVKDITLNNQMAMAVLPTGDSGAPLVLLGVLTVSLILFIVVSVIRKRTYE